MPASSDPPPRDPRTSALRAPAPRGPADDEGGRRDGGPPGDGAAAEEEAHLAMVRALLAAKGMAGPPDAPDFDPDEVPHHPAARAAAGPRDEAAALPEPRPVPVPSAAPAEWPLRREIPPAEPEPAIVLPREEPVAPDPSVPVQRDGSEAPSLGEATRALSGALRREVAGGTRALGSGIAQASGRLVRGAAGVRARADAPPTRPAPRPAPAPAEPVRPRRRAAAPGAQVIRRGWRLFLGTILLLAMGAGATIILVWSVMRDLPLAEVLPPLPEPTIAVQLADGQALTTRGAYRAPYVGLEEMPAHLVEAVIAIEDQRFREHSGVDLRGIARAALQNLNAGSVVQGGSTISQQLVKILYLEPARTLERKLQEAVLAVMMERQLGKDRILELYLNSVYMGSGAYGMPAAAETYFGKDVGDLTLPESALLAASIQLPSQVNPNVDLGATQNRAALVLTAMEEQGRIDVETRDRALSQLAVLSPSPPPTRAGSYFADWVLREAQGLRGSSGQGITATATLDPRLQAEAERIVREVMADQGAAAGATQAALVAMTPDGRVRAMVGGIDYAQSQFNRATEARRQPGSTFKLLVYMVALLMGAEIDATAADVPIEIDGWQPENFDGVAHGEVPLVEAFAQSYNLAAVRLGQFVGIDRVIEVARQFGIEAELQATPSLALGTSEVTLLDMTEAYAGVALGRVPVEATGISVLRFGDGRALEVSGAGEQPQVTLNRTREPIRTLLRAVVTQGTGRAAALPGVTVYGKTGTSQNNRDAWFIGFTDQMVIGVWVGNDDNSPMAEEATGGRLPAEIFRRTMQAALTEGPAPAAQGQPAAAPLQCNLRACTQAYRSFDPETCTYQPFEGPRQICTR